MAAASTVPRTGSSSAASEAAKADEHSGKGWRPSFEALEKEPEHWLRWHFGQCFGDKDASTDFSEADILSAVEFDPTGQFLATGDKGGRVVIFRRADADPAPGDAARSAAGTVSGASLLARARLRLTKSSLSRSPSACEPLPGSSSTWSSRATRPSLTT